MSVKILNLAEVYYMNNLHGETNISLRYGLAFPISSIGLILNILCFIIFHRRAFNFRHFKYFKIYSLNSVFSNLIDLYSYFYESNSKMNKIFAAIVYPYVKNSLYFFSRMINCFVLLERVLNNCSMLKYIHVCSVYGIAFISFLFSFLVNSQSIFYLDVESNNSWSNTTQLNSSKYVLYQTNFGNSEIGTALFFLGYYLKEVVLMSIELYLNYSSILLLFKNVRKPKVDQIELSSEDVTNEETENSSRVEPEGVNTKKNKKSDKKITYLTTVFCTYCHLIHFIILGLEIYKLVEINVILVGNFQFYECLLMTITQSSDFFFFLLNRRFRRYFSKILYGY